MTAGGGLGGPRTDDGDQIPQIPNSGSNPLEGTLNSPRSNLVGGTTRGGRSVDESRAAALIFNQGFQLKSGHTQCSANLAFVIFIQTHVRVTALVLDGQPVFLAW